VAHPTITRYEPDHRRAIVAARTHSTQVGLEVAFEREGGTGFPAQQAGEGGTELWSLPPMLLVYDAGAARTRCVLARPLTDEADMHGIDT